MYSNDLVCNILNYIHQNINKEITIDELSTFFYFDKTYLMKTFKKELGISIHQYINTIRIYNSLIYYQDSISFLSIGLKNGFHSLEYFSETFHKIMGVSPRIYKNYVNHNPITKKEEDVILNSIHSILLIKNNVSKYLSYQKPRTQPVKVLKIFR